MKLTYTLLLVKGGALHDPAALLDGFVRGRIGKIDVNAGHDRAVGFARFEDPLNAEFADPADYHVPPLVAFSFRVDRIHVPASTLRLAIKSRIAENLAATRREKMPRQEREELTEDVRRGLMLRTPATITAFPVVWDLAAGRVRISTRSAAVVEDFLVRARECLGVDLQMATIPALLEGLTEKEQHEAYHLLPASFVAGSGAGRGKGEG